MQDVTHTYMHEKPCVYIQPDLNHDTHAVIKNFLPFKCKLKALFILLYL